MVANGFNLGQARGAIIIDASGVSSAIQQAQRDMDGGLQGIGRSLEGIGAQFNAVGGALLRAFAPLGVAFGAATMQAMTFEESIVNIGAVLNLSVDEMNGLSESLQNMGEDTRYGANEVAAAYYDIAGGVADASLHMSIMETAIHTAQAGNASLTGTTSALISIMNGYSFAADKAGFASDVLTRAVGMGVGTMDQFGAALPMVAGLAASVGIEFDDLGAAMAFITTKGVSASEAATQLQGMINALLRPSAAMEAALKKIGFASGAAALKQLGLVGTFNALKDSGADIPEITGRIEGLRGAIALTGEGFDEFATKFAEGIDGATAAAEAIQMESAAAKFDLFKASIQDVAISVGNALLPVLTSLLESVMPIIDAISQWIQENPELIAQIAQIVMIAIALGGALTVIGAIISTVGAILASPLLVIGLIVGALVLLAQHFGITWEQIQVYGNLIVLYAQYYFGQVVTAVQGVIDSIRAFIDQNPELVVAFGIIAAAILLPTALVAAFGIVTGLASAAVGILTAALGVLFSPVVILAAAIAALLFALNSLYPGGIAQCLRDAGLAAQQLAAIFFFYLSAAANWARDRLTELMKTIIDVIAKIQEFKTNLETGVGAIGNILGSGASIEQILNAIGAEIQGAQQPTSAGASAAQSLIGAGGGASFKGFAGSGTQSAGSFTGGSSETYNVQIYANSQAGGEAAAVGFTERFNELKRRSG